MAFFTFNPAKRKELLPFEASGCYPKSSVGNMNMLLACTAVTAAVS
jgi:hypothetical protein